MNEEKNFFLLKFAKKVEKLHEFQASDDLDLFTFEMKFYQRNHLTNSRAVIQDLLRNTRRVSK